MADYLHVLAAIALLWFAATLTPGPDFLLASRVSMALPREAALRVVLGIACGTVLWGLAGFVGRLLTAAPAAAAYSRLRRWIDRIAGAAFIGFGTRLALER